ncbi:hypothetical protein ACKWTF_006501 [Chironomus riparius]
MKRIFLLLFFIGFIGHKARGNYDDPAPGRSPGPPLQQTSSSLQLANDFYSIEGSHEAYRPHETSSKLQQQQQLQNNNNDNNPEVETIMNNENRFSDIFSSMSRENIEYHDNTNENENNHDFIATTNDDDGNDDMINIHRQKLIINKSTERLQQNDSDDETALNALKNSSLSLQPTQHVSSSSRPNLDTIIMNSINPISENNANETIKMMKMVESVKSDGCGPSAKILKYLSLGDKVVKINLSDSDKESYDSRIPNGMGRLRIYVTHDVFSTETSLLAGIIYKVEVPQPQPRDIIDFILESTTENGNVIGIFPETPVDYHRNGYANEVVRNGIQQIVTSDSDNKKLDANRNSNNKKQSVIEQNDCERNVLYHKFSLSDEKVTLNWTTGDVKLSNESNLVNFRLLYRYRNKREIFEINFSLSLLQDCSLTLKDFTGWLDSTLLPYRYKNCTFHFPKLIQNQYKSQPPGMLVRLMRLNVPCTSGGFIRFNKTITLCGKLEELSESQRTLYFQSFDNTSFSIFNYPKFYFVYKLVDYCYNVTLMDQNSSFIIQPMSHLALKCHFKIHLPFGHNIALKLRLNGSDNVPNVVRDIQMTHSTTRNDDHSMHLDYNKIDDEFIELENFAPNTDSFTFESHRKIDCEWILIEIINRMNEKWSECLKLSDRKANIEFKLASPDNVLLIRITKRQQMAMQQISSTNVLDSTTIMSENNVKKEISFLNLEYTAVPIENIVSQCAFGWILIGQYCVASFDELMTWDGAENKCNELGGHLASISNENEQQLVDRMLINSAHYNEHVSYWIGATDKYFEGDFRWTDGQQFSFTKWFPGWQEHGNYNRQPNDDGLSEQDCVEIRKFYHRPSTSGISSTTTSLTESFMWNDRDCATRNFFLCERPLIDEPVGTLETEDCNKTIHLTRDNMKMSITSPGYPRYYSDNINCFTFITAIPGFRIFIEFEEMVLENEPQCSYDFVEMFEPFSNSTMRSTRQKRNKEEMKINDFSSIQQQQFLEFQQLLRDYENQKAEYRNIFQPSNSTYNTFIPPPSTLSDRMPRKMCGDWSSKLKLLRYRSRSNFLGIRFSSDYSHHFSGYKAKISLEKDVQEMRAASECVDERLKLFNESCYLVVSFPEVEWVVAQKICHSLGAQLSSVSSSDEHRFIVTAIRNNAEYNHRRFYWLGGEYSKDGEFEWTDGSKISFTGGWTQGQEKLMSKALNDPVCLGLQWKSTGSLRLPSNLFWSSQKCSQLGGYVCKQNKKSNTLIQNMTITEIEGRLTSPDYPNQYSSNINYWVKIIAPKRSRIIMQFQKIDIEYQQECLYDYVSIQDSEFHYVQTNQNDLNSPSTKNGDANSDETSTRHVLDRRRKRAANKIEIKTVGVNDSSPSFQAYVRWCGSHDGDMSKFDFVSRSNEILLNFFTDNAIAGEGFSAIWRSIDLSACPGQTLTSREGNISSPNFPHFLFHNLNCSYTIQAPIGRKIWIEFLTFNIEHDASVHIDLGDGVLLQPFQDSTIVSDGVFASVGEHVKIFMRTGNSPRGKGFNVVFRTMPQIVEHRIVNLSNSTFGRVYHLNYPHSRGMPESIDYTQHLIAPSGDVISIELRSVQFTENGCNDSAVIEIYDKYADRNGTFWQLCTINTKIDSNSIKQTSAPAIFITSYLNTIHIRQYSNNNQLGFLNATVRVQSDINFKIKLITSTEDWVESCNPNPCQHGGKCILSGKKQICQCIGHYTGRFCGLTMCELEPCVFGQCELTVNGFKCHCQSGYLGMTCDQRQKPCNDNPCENRGQCVEKNGGYECRCFAWFEGPKCERRMKIPYRPLSERMLQEPFWLGLITVFVVLSVIGMVWCAKRHFPEKIEKLLQEEADRNRPSHLRHHHHISLREQLQVAGAANNPIMQGSTGQANVTTPGSDSRKSIFNRLDNHHTSHVGTPSPRKKRNNSTPTRKNNAEKKQILQQLVSPNTNKVTLGELIQLSESSNAIVHANNSSHDSDDIKETAFNDSSTSTLVGTGLLTRQLSSDPKLEKKVTFARLLSKMSAEITSGTDIDGNHSSALSLPTEVQFRASSVPPSPCTNDIRSPHSTSSNQGSGSLSSSELALHDFSLRQNSIRKQRPKVSSADSILAMFRNFASSNAGINLPASLIISPSSTPTASSPQDDIVGDDESSTSSIPTPVSFTSNAPESPIFYRQSTIEVPVLDAINAHKSQPMQSHLHPPTILLEIPGNINKCLSPIRELPTPMPSPALTPVMPRPHRMIKSQQVHDETISVTFSDEDVKNQPQHKPHHILVDLSTELNRREDSENEDSITTPTNTISSSDNSRCSVRQSKLVSMPAIDICPPTPVDVERKIYPLSQRPKDLIIPDLIIQTPSPTKERLPLLIFPGSPPPQRASIGETSGLFPNRQQQKRLMMQYEKYEKPGSLDFQFAPPMITIIPANMSEAESDAEFISPATSKASLMPHSKHLLNPSGMTHLSPFSMCTRGDRAPSEGNLSSSGYSSMASPGPSRCNSNNPLCPNEIDCNSSQCGDLTIVIPTIARRHQSILKKTDDSKKGNENNSNDCEQQFRKRSDSETLSDETLLESNDEGIGTDHLDEKIEDGDIRSAKELEIFIGKEFLENGKTLMGTEEVLTMSQLQLPSIVIQSESGYDKLSPVSSRSESPLSDRNNNGMGRFSPQFYNKREQQLPFTDSDGLYDFPSSDGKSSGHYRKTVGKRRDKRNLKSNQPQSPSKSSVLLEIPQKAITINCTQTNVPAKYNSVNVNRKSPKRRSHARYTPSSSSSTESLTTTKEMSMPSIKLRDCLIENIESRQYVNVLDDADKYGPGSSSFVPKKTAETMVPKKVEQQLQQQPKKLSRLKAIGNQIRFLRRLEQALRDRDKNMSDSCNDNESDIMDSPKVTSPLLASSKNTAKQKPSAFKFARQKRVVNVYTFEPDRENSLLDKDFLSD